MYTIVDADFFSQQSTLHSLCTKDTPLSSSWRSFIWAYGGWYGKYISQGALVQWRQEYICETLLWWENERDTSIASWGVGAPSQANEQYIGRNDYGTLTPRFYLRHQGFISYRELVAACWWLLREDLCRGWCLVLRRWARNASTSWCLFGIHVVWDAKW